MGYMIFGSNMQERAGMGPKETIKLCRQIFEGGKIDAVNVDPRTREVQSTTKTPSSTWS
jgi:hypothetical protein